jgi:hypothetical protein
VFVPRVLQHSCHISFVYTAHGEMYEWHLLFTSSPTLRRWFFFFFFYGVFVEYKRCSKDSIELLLTH